LKKNISIEKIAALTGHQAAVFALAQGKNTQFILSGSGEGWVVQWDLENPDLGKLIAQTKANIFSLLYVPDQNMVVAGDMNGGVHWLHLNDATLNKHIAHHRRGVFGIQTIDNQVFTLGGDGILTRWQVQPIRSLESIQLTNVALRAMTFAPNSDKMAVGASDGNIYILNSSTFELLQIIEKAHSNSVFCVHFSPDGKYLLSGGRDAQLKVWEVEANFNLFQVIPAHWFTINDLVFHPTRPIFATASRDKTIKIWDANTFELLKVIDGLRLGGHLRSVNRLFWSSYNDYLVACSDDRSVSVWKVAE
jgi:WD40 repeat protein